MQYGLARRPSQFLPLLRRLQPCAAQIVKQQETSRAAKWSEVLSAERKDALTLRARQSGFFNRTPDSTDASPPSEHGSRGIGRPVDVCRKDLQNFSLRFVRTRSALGSHPPITRAIIIFPLPARVITVLACCLLHPKLAKLPVKLCHPRRFMDIVASKLETALSIVTKRPDEL